MKPSEREGNDEVISKEPCPDCGSQDNLVRYADGHAHCFTPGCGRHERGEIGAGEGNRPASRPELSMGSRRSTSGEPANFLSPQNPQSDIRARGLKAATLKRFGYFVGTFNGKSCHVAPYFDAEGNLAHQKVRLPDKSFPVIKGEDAPDISKCQLFGAPAFGDRFDRKVVVTEGEIDAMSVAQAMDFKIACVSVNTGSAGAKRCLQNNYQWLDRFSEIILWFDEDAAGKAALDECAPLFDVGKVKIAKAVGFKDAGEALSANKPGDIQAAVWAATSWKPKGIVNAAEIMEDIGPIPAWPYPWLALNEYTLGMRRGEVTYHVGGTGIAKTTLLYHYAASLLVVHGPIKGVPAEIAEPKIGWLGFEDTVRSVQAGILSVHAQRRLHMDPLPRDEMRKLHTELFGTGRVELYDPENAEWGMKAAMSYIRFMVKALECSVIVIDPLSFLIAQLPHADRVSAESRVAADMAALAKSLNIHLHISHHLRKSSGGDAFEEGAEVSLEDMRGSGSLGHFANNIFAYERDQQGERPDLLRVRVLKCRLTGNTGIAGILKYNTLSGVYAPTTDRWPDKEGSKQQRSGGFGRAPSYGAEY